MSHFFKILFVSILTWSSMSSAGWLGESSIKGAFGITLGEVTKSNKKRGEHFTPMKLKILQFILLLIFTTSASAVTLICEGESYTRDNDKCGNGCKSFTVFSVVFDAANDKLLDVSNFLYCKGGFKSSEINSSYLDFSCDTSRPVNGKVSHSIDRITGDYYSDLLNKKGEYFGSETGKCKVGKKLF
jgi:hypothetical protein